MLTAASGTDQRKRRAALSLEADILQHSRPC